MKGIAILKYSDESTYSNTSRSQAYFNSHLHAWYNKYNTKKFPV